MIVCSWFDVSGSTFDEHTRENDFYIFVVTLTSLIAMCTIGLQLHIHFTSGELPFDLKFAPLVPLDHGHVSTKLEFSTTFLFREIGGAGRTDGRTDGHGATPSTTTAIAVLITG